MEDLRQLYEAAVSRSKELEAENADLSASVARLDVDRLKDEFLAMVSHELRTRSRSSWAWPRPWSGGPTWPPPPTARRFCSGSSARANVCATWSSSCSRPARSWPTAARCCGPRRSWPPRWWPRWSTTGGWPSPTAASSCACPTGPASSQGDAEALRMVVGNLVDNAGKHAPPGHPHPGHGRPARGPDPDPGHRRRRGGGRDRPGAHLRSLHPARRLHHPAGGWGRPRPVPGRSAGQGHGGQGLGGRTPPAAGPVSWSSCPTWPRYRIAPPAPGTAGAVEASKPV